MRVGIGDVLLDRYRLTRTLGAGGVGTAYVARDEVLDVDVALKLVPPAGDGLALLRREFEALVGLHHPSLVEVRDFGVSRGGAFYTSSLVPGLALSRWAVGRSVAELLAVIAQVLHALHFLHLRGLVHGDVQPDNVLVGDDGAAVLIDLSCVRVLGEAPFVVGGRAPYAAPEALAGDPRPESDVYALGRVLAELADAPPPRVARAVARMVRSDWRARPRTAAEVAEALGLAPVSVPQVATLRSALVGREVALAALETFVATLARPADARSRVLAIRGSPGAGRSRVLAALRHRAQPHMRVVDVLGAAPHALSATLSRLAGTARARGIASALDALEEIAAGAPLLFAIDDADALDPRDLALVRSLARSSRRGAVAMALVTSSEPAELVGVLDVRVVEVTPLDAASVRAWLGSGGGGRELSADEVSRLVRKTRGLPGAIVDVLARVPIGATKRAVDALLDDADAATPGLRDVVGRELTALAALVARGSLDAGEAERLEVAAPLEVLARRGLVARRGRGWTIRARRDAEVLARARPRELARAHASCLERLDLDAPSRAAHLAALGRRDEAASLLLGPASGGDTRALRVAAERLLCLVDDGAPVDVGAVDALTAGARALDLAGEPRRALALLSRALRARPAPEIRARIWGVAGGAYTRLGDVRRAARCFERALAVGPASRAERARLGADRSLALLKRGDHAGAAAAARRAYEDAPPGDPVALDVACSAALAAGYLGDRAEASAWLARAREVRPGASARGAFRLFGAEAFVAYRGGDADVACDAYRAALELADAEGLDDLVASAALNFGTASHQRGDWGPALSAYTRGLRVAIALGMPSTEVMFAFNLSKLYADIGAFERSLTYADDAHASAERVGMPFMMAAALSVRGEVDRLMGKSADALERLAEARRLFVECGAEREAIEVSLEQCEAHLAARDVDAARRALEAATVDVARVSSAFDVEARVAGLRARLGASTPPDVVSTLERALSSAERSGQRALVAATLGALADACRAAGAAYLADRHGARARELWERTLSTLPAELHGAFWSHPARRALGLSGAGAIPAESREARAGHAAITADAPLWRELAEISRRVASAASVSEVLDETLLAAIRITRAERGFLLLRGARGALSVAAARNLDRDKIGRGHLKFSRTIAERVVRSGEPLVTTDAAMDPRLSRARSVHAMALKAVLCVPIRASGETLGAVYVDHRFRAEPLDERIDALLAFADLAALALEKAHTVAALEARTRELEARTREVEALAADQAREIERLEASRASASTPRRHDFSRVIARGDGMRRVLDVLDRVADADVTVLLQGESGTGKELLSRALHDASPRASGPFVGINCGAVPESLLEGELFGYQRGAFTGASRDHQGLLLAASGGTLFLDEIGEMPASMQVKLLRALQDRVVRPLGAVRDVAFDVRLVCATHRDLVAEVDAGRFRADLYYRVAVVDVRVPPLRERPEDVLPIAQAVLARLAARYGRPAPRLTRRAERALLAHGWAGNVRELENVLTKAFVLAGEGAALDREDLDLATSSRRKDGGRARVVAALEATRWNVVEVSRSLGIPRATLYRRMRRWGLERPEV